MTRKILAAPLLLLLVACGPAPISGQRCVGPAASTPAPPPLPTAKPVFSPTGLVASRWQPGHVAVWDANTLVIHARDDTPRRLTLPADLGRVATATFDGQGRLHLLSESGVLLSWARGDGAPERRELDFARDTVQLTSTRRHLVWVGQPHRSYVPPPARASSDGGRTWTIVDAPDGGNAGLEIAVELDGGLQLMTGSEAACGGGGQHRDSGGLGQRSADWRALPWPLDAPYGWFLGPRGWAYARLEKGEVPRQRASPRWNRENSTGRTASFTAR